MINTESELREAIAWFREMNLSDCVGGELNDHSRVLQFDGWWVRGYALTFYLATRQGELGYGYTAFAVAPWLVARLQKRCATEGTTE